jgi:succinate-semialdehyde dehydrogenase/glutarate-semialdehyde dehydrogenase
MTGKSLVQRLRDPDLLKTQSWIGGHWVGEPEFAVCDPADGVLIANVPYLGREAAEQAVVAASAALRAWSSMTGKERGACLRVWFEAITSAKQDLALILTAEQGKPLAEAEAEIDYAASFVEFYAEEAKRIHGEVLSSPRRDARVLVLRQPIGVVATITPWNFPAAMITRKVAPAIAAGCTVVLKPAPETPLTALALARLAERSGLPAGVLNVITGDAVAIGEIFTSLPAVRALSFTGSTQVGKILAQRCSATLKRVVLELGGNAPFLVFDDADLGQAVQGAMLAKFRNTGQTCVCVNRFYVHTSVYERFITMLQKAVRTLRSGHGFDPQSTQGPLIKSTAVDKVRRHVADALDKGATVVDGQQPSHDPRFYPPIVLRDVQAGMLITQEETFGPVAAVIRFEHEAEALQMANDTTAGLAAYVYTRDLSRTIRIAEALECGMVGVNSGAISTELAPFGGVKESGNSREGSHHGIEEFLQLKYVLIGGQG